MANTVLKITDKLIEYSFYLLLFFVPLILTPYNFELFEYNKMMVTYALTVIIVGSWIIKMIVHKEIRIARTPLDIPLILFLLSQVIATLLSVDRHMSIWGYYSRFNGGLLSVVSYLLLYYAFVTNFPGEKIKKLLFIALSSGFLVSIYGILEHLGIDRDLWVQDVQNRVFSTLGQPNWLAAYLAVLIPLTTGLGLYYISNQYSDYKDKNQKGNVKFFSTGLLGYWIIGSIFYVTLLFTKSRSGFGGFWIANAVFWLLLLLRFRKNIIKPFLILNISYLMLIFIFGTPFPQINRFTLGELTRNQQSAINNQQLNKPLGSSIIDVGITESGTIRRIVWNGAIDIFRHYPLFGTGVETFALSYYKFRPIAHNMTSEWDFLYNKAHNEYLNYAATTGAFGLGSYLLIIIGFIWWNIKNLKSQISNLKITNKNSKLSDNKKFLTLNCDFAFCILHFAFFSAWFSILVTNFFGFSVVIIQLFFFLIPAISFVLSKDMIPLVLFSFQSKPINGSNVTINIYQKILILFLFSVACYLLFVIFRLWYADTVFARGYHLSHSGEPDYLASYKALKQAISLNSSEPFYFDELALPAAMLSVALSEEKFATSSSQLQDEAILASNIALTISPNNVNFWKSRTRLFYTLATLDEKYFNQAKEALIKAADLSPTDPKLSYNLALIYDRLGEKEKAFDQLLQTTKLKQDYKEAYLALGLLYQQDKQKEKAKEAFNFILTRLDPNDEIAKMKMEELK